VRGPRAGGAGPAGGLGQAGQHGVGGGVADHVEARLDPGQRARPHVRGDRVGLEVAVPGAGGGVGVGGAQGGGARAQRAVDEQVTGQAAGAGRGEQLARGGRRRDGLAPVGDDLRTGERRQGEQTGEVGDRGDVRAGALVHGADPVGGGVGQEGPLGGGAGGAVDGGERGAAGVVVGLGGQRPARPPGGSDRGRGAVQQGAGDQRGVHVDAAEVDRGAAGGAVQFGARRWRPRPALVLPAVTPDQAPGSRPGARGDGVEHLERRPGGGQVEAVDQQAGGRGVHVGVDERRGEHRSGQVQHGGGGSGPPGRRGGGPGPGDAPRLGLHGLGRGGPGRVHHGDPGQQGAHPACLPDARPPPAGGAGRVDQRSRLGIRIHITM
jgi:hypothetical protein